MDHIRHCRIVPYNPHVFSDVDFAAAEVTDRDVEDHPENEKSNDEGNKAYDVTDPFTLTLQTNKQSVDQNMHYSPDAIRSNLALCEEVYSNGKIVFYMPPAHFQMWCPPPSPSWKNDGQKRVLGVISRTIQDIAKSFKEMF
ncbi:hypothetical protein FQA39_LY17651 [Lamprigera yunnana]|nr:hypothetical protein FQA39_LY17651 [Lamprigera yunnana]